jgi:large conductance mechanosensitive channel
MPDETEVVVLQGFKDFIARGNVIDLAVAVVIGAAFTKVVDSLVTNLINPVIGAFGTESLDGYRLCLKGPCGPLDDGTIGGVYIGWGAIIGAFITFVLTAAAVYFFFVLPYNKYRERNAPVEGDVADELDEQTELLREIRDALTSGSARGARSD